MSHNPDPSRETNRNPDDLAEEQPRFSSDRLRLERYQDPAESRRRKIFELCSKAVPYIEVMRQDGRSGVGSGVLVDHAQGIVLTNYHVVSNAEQVLMSFSDGARQVAKMIFSDASTDLAVMRVPRLPDRIQEVPLGESDNLFVGQDILAIGNQFGQYNCSLTSGIISGLNRNIRTASSGRLQKLIQVDAAVNQGNSGGPLLDTDGTVIGINTAIMSPSGGFNGVAFAIPIDEIKESLSKRFKPTIGISLVDSHQGVLISRVEPGSPAARVGMAGYLDLALPPERAWKLSKVQGVEILSAEHAANIIQSTPADEDIYLTVSHFGHETTFELLPAIIFA